MSDSQRIRQESYTNYLLTTMIDPTYAPLEDCDPYEHSKHCGCYWCIGDREDEQIDRIVWQQKVPLIDRIPFILLELFVGGLMLFLAIGVLAALGDV